MSETKDEKKARLAQALRDNLRRRKAQARAGSQPGEVQRDRSPKGDDPAN